MKKVLLSMLALLCLAAPLAAAEGAQPQAPANGAAADGVGADVAALKSFGAWYLKNWNKTDGIHAAFQGWLDDPAVPDSFKLTGLERRQDMEDAVNKLAQMREQAIMDASGMAQEAAEAAKDAKLKVEDAFSEWLDDAISGKQAPANQ